MTIEGHTSKYDYFVLLPSRLGETVQIHGCRATIVHPTSETFAIDPSQVEAAIVRTRSVFALGNHYGGQYDPVDVDAVISKINSEGYRSAFM